MRKIGVFDLDGTLYTSTQTFAVANELLLLEKFKDYREKVEEAYQTWQARGSVEAYWTYNKQMLQTFEAILPNTSEEELKSAASNALQKTKNHAMCTQKT